MRKVIIMARIEVEQVRKRKGRVRSVERGRNRRRPTKVEPGKNRRRME